MDQKKKRLWTMLGGFLALAVFCTYLSRQIQIAFLPVVETAEPFPAALRLNRRAQGQIVYEDAAGEYAPVELKIAEVFVREGQTVSAGDPILRADLLHLEAAAEELENRLRRNAASTRSQTGERQALLLQKEIAQLELELSRTRREQASALEERRRQAEELSQSEQEAESALQLEIAMAALDDYESRFSVDNEARALRRAVLRVQMELDQSDLTPEERTALEERLASARLDLQAYRRLPSYQGSGSEAERLQLELSLLQAEHALLQSEDSEEQNAAQLLRKLDLLEREQARQQEEKQAFIEEQKLELAVLECQNRLDELAASQAGNISTPKQDQELRSTLEAVRGLIETDGILFSGQSGQILSIEIREGERVPGESYLYQLSLPSSACVRWEMDAEQLEPGESVSAFLTYWEEAPDGRIKKERPTALTVTSKRWNGTGYEYTAAIPGENASGLAMEEQAPVEVLIDKKLESYKVVVPVSAITFRNEHQGTLFYLVEEDGQLFSRQETVEILEYDQDNAALLDNLHSEVIVYSDRPLTSGGRVRKDG